MGKGKHARNPKAAEKEDVAEEQTVQQAKAEEVPIVVEAKEAVRTYISENTEEELPEYDLHVLWVVEVPEYWKVYLYASFDDNIRYLVTHENATEGR